MESTVSFSILMELIQIVGAFVTAPIFFNLSVIHILIISFVFNMVIGILLGGVDRRVANIPNTLYKPPQVRQTPVTGFDKLKGVKESYTGGGSY